MTSRNVEHSQTWKQSGSTGLQDQNEEVAGRTERGTEDRGEGILSRAVETRQSLINGFSDLHI